MKEQPSEHSLLERSCYCARDYWLRDRWMDCSRRRTHLLRSIAGGLRVGWLAAPLVVNRRQAVKFVKCQPPGERWA